MKIKRYENVKFKRYYSEVITFLKKEGINIDNYPLKIHLGPKGNGKSTAGFKSFLQAIKEGKKVAYVRNSEEELKKIKLFIFTQCQNATSDILKLVGFEIINKTTNRIICSMVSSKNYDKISGNVEPIDLVFYDEFIQDLGTKTMKIINNFFTIQSTLFRDHPWNLIICGNPLSKNNPIFNLYKLDMPEMETSLEVFNVDDYILIIRYRNDIFEHKNMDSKDLAMIKKYNGEQYNNMFVGNNPNSYDDLVVNNVEHFEKFEDTDVLFEVDYRFYSLQQYKEAYFLRHIPKPTKEELKDKIKNGCRLIADTAEVLNMFFSSRSDEEDALIRMLYHCIKNDQLFFNDYNIYHWFIDIIPPSLVKIINKLN